MDKLIQEYLEVDSTSCTGLRWIKTSGSRAKVGAEAFTSINRGGYYAGTMRYNVLTAHRVVWFLTYNEWPDCIDHINGDKLDNTPSNLRSVTRRENSSNRIGKGYTSRTRNGRTTYIAHITIQGKPYRSREYSTPEEARERYLALKRVHHPESAARLDALTNLNNLK